MRTDNRLSLAKAQILADEGATLILTNIDQHGFHHAQVAIKRLDVVACF